MEVLETIKTRRSVRRYKPDPADDPPIDTIPEATRWTPSRTIRKQNPNQHQEKSLLKSSLTINTDIDHEI